MNTKQALLQFVQQIMHEGIDALIDRIANRVIEKLDEARMSMPQTAAEYDKELPQPRDVVKPQPNNVTEPRPIEPQLTEPRPTEPQPGKAYHEQSVTPSLTEQAMQLVDEMYDTRYNVLDRVAEIRRHNGASAQFVPVSKLVRNTIVIDLHKRGCMVWNNDVDRILESDYMPQYHPFTSYLKSLPAWDGTDRVTPLAARVVCFTSRRPCASVLCAVSRWLMRANWLMVGSGRRPRPYSARSSATCGAWCAMPRLTLWDVN